MPTLAAFFLLGSIAQFGRPVLQPAQVASAAGAYVLHLEPSSPSGEGPMHCRLMHGSELAWESEFPWTFERAGVAEDGTVVGYANFEGKPVDALRIVVLDGQGRVRKQHDIAHEAWFPGGGSLPRASGDVLIQDGADLALVRVRPADQRRPAPWMTLRLSTGERAGEIDPSPPRKAQGEGVYQRDAHVVGDTGLTLNLWWYVDYEPDDLEWYVEGVIFNLLDLEGESVWELRWLDDYTDRTDERADDRMEFEFRERSPILAAGPGNQFAVRNFQRGERVQFLVERDSTVGSGWRVREIGRAPFEDPKDRVHPAQTVALERLGTVTLGAPTAGALSPIHDVRAIGFSDGGSLEILRLERPQKLSVARLGQDGSLEFERDLSALFPSPDAYLTGCFDLPGERWLLQLGRGPSPWIEVDVETGSTTACPLPEVGSDCSIAPTEEGGYLALLPQELWLVRADGSVGWKEQVWGTRPDDSDFRRAVCLGRGLVSVGGDIFALLAMDDLSLIDVERRLLRRTPLESVLGRRPVYATDPVPDGAGGVYFHEGDRFWHVDAAGNPAGTLVPRRADGSRDPLFESRLRMAPDGRLWTSDGARLYRLTDSGVADLELGLTRVDGELAEPDDALIDAHGRILLRDRFSRSVHVFDSDGVRLFVGDVSLDERSDDTLFESMLSLPDGSIWVAVKGGCVRFGADGERVEVHPGELEGLDPLERAFEPLVRRPDGGFLEHVGGRALLEDGRRVLFEGPSGPDALPMLHLYDEEGAPIRSIELPEGTRGMNLNASRRWLVLGSYGPSWTLVGLEDEQVLRFDSGLPDPGNWFCGQSPNGHVLLLWNSSRRELVRFALP